MKQQMKGLMMIAIFGMIAICAGAANGQTAVVFAKGANSKTIKVTIPAKGEKTFSLAVRAGQVINADVSGDIYVSKTNEFPVISLNLANADEELDRSQDGEGYLSILTGRRATYVISVSNSSSRARTFNLTFKVTNDPEDFLGGTDVEQ